MDEICKNLLVYIGWQGPWYGNPLANEELVVSLFTIERNKRSKEKIFNFHFIYPAVPSCVIYPKPKENSENIFVQSVFI